MVIYFKLAFKISLLFFILISSLSVEDCYSKSPRDHYSRHGDIGPGYFGKRTYGRKKVYYRCYTGDYCSPPVMNREKLLNFYQYFTALSRISLKDQNGNMITNRKLRLNLSIQSIGYKGHDPLKEVRIRKDLKNWDKVTNNIIIDEQGKIILPINDYLITNKNWRETESEKNWRVLEGEDIYGQPELVLDLLNGTTDQDIATELKNNFSIIGEIQDLGPAKDLELVKDKQMLQELKEILEKNEKKKLEIVKELPFLKIDKLKTHANNSLAISANGTEKMNDFFERINQFKKLQEEESEYKKKVEQVKKYIVKREHLPELKGEKIEITDNEGHILISDFMSTNASGKKLTPYWRESGGTYIYIHQQRSIFAIEGSINTDIYQQQLDKVLKQ